MAVHVLTNSIEATSCHAIRRMSVSNRLELGFGEWMEGWMDGWMDTLDEGMVCMFCDKVIENKKLSDNLGENLWIKKNGA